MIAAIIDGPMCRGGLPEAEPQSLARGSNRSRARSGRAQRRIARYASTGEPAAGKRPPNPRCSVAAHLPIAGARRLGRRAALGALDLKRGQFLDARAGAAAVGAGWPVRISQARTNRRRRGTTKSMTSPPRGSQPRQNHRPLNVFRLKRSEPPQFGHGPLRSTRPRSRRPREAAYSPSGTARAHRTTRERPDRGRGPWLRPPRRARSASTATGSGRAGKAPIRSFPASRGRTGSERRIENGAVLMQIGEVMQPRRPCRTTPRPVGRHGNAVRAT